MKTGSPSVPSSRRRVIRARKVSIHRFAEWQNRPISPPSRSLARLLKALVRHWRGLPGAAGRNTIRGPSCWAS